MLKFLAAPSIRFASDLVCHLTSGETEEKYKRILIHPITNGLRLRNLESTLRVEFEILGGVATTLWTEVIEHDGLHVPYSKPQAFSPSDIHLIAEKIEGFFERKWEIEKDA